MNSPRIFISILHYNNFELTNECIKSVIKSDYKRYKLNIIDNGSKDDSVSKLKLNYPNINIIKIKKNIGFTGGQNVALMHGLQSNLEYLYLMTNDTIIDKSGLRHMVELMDSDTKIGASSPKIYLHQQA